MKQFDLTPDPRVLLALTHTPLRPLDALCELIDNSLDSFRVSALRGASVKSPMVIVDLPTPSRLDDEGQSVSVRDNGPGMSAEDAERALKAGFSSQNPYDTLGLFGMGFNISTGKIGQRTRFLTAQEADDFAVEVVVDLPKLIEAGSYNVPVSEVPKPAGFLHGTLVEVSHWWPNGHANSGFVRKLIGVGKPAIRRNLGRRYATVLQSEGYRILVDEESCVPFEHCVWGGERSVERKGHGRIPARYDINEVAGSQRRCVECWALVPDGAATCDNCGGASTRTIEERVRGWLGIQRFDDQTLYGVDLIRNGRAIRIGEKQAFFEYIDETGMAIRDYPIDSPYGRIVGEIHLDHVPVDFTKRDFQRSSEEWQRAMSLLRGDTSLQPGLKGDKENDAPMYKLYQGYRRVRRVGTHDMYMGTWVVDAGKARRIDRKTEKEFYTRFKAHEVGYHDDAEWWNLVLQADTMPMDDLVKCPNPECQADNLKGHETCSICGAVILGKTCVKSECTMTIPQSATVCPHCGTGQAPEATEPWTCASCSTRNTTEAEACTACGWLRGSPGPLSREHLESSSHLDETLSVMGCSIPLADSEHSSPIDVRVWTTQGRIPTRDGNTNLPSATFRGDGIDVFLDATHELFRGYGLRPEHVIAMELAQYIYTVNTRLTSAQYAVTHSLPCLHWSMLKKYWADRLCDDPAAVRNDISDLLGQVRNRLAESAGSEAADLFEELTPDQQRGFASNLLSSDVSLDEIDQLRSSGGFVRYVDGRSVASFVRKRPELFFDGAVWDEPYASIAGLQDDTAETLRADVRSSYLNCLEDCVRFEGRDTGDQLLVRRARSSVAFLQRKLS